ncbi:MAG: hypothetical protein U5S82_18270 [Gammaproteobacteria bacterium]|nr:hypothetical protein [Gammaproteobacteria bacterium]
MIVKRIFLSWLVPAFILLSVSSVAHAALYSRLNGLAYYDDVLDITWLADANAAVGTAYDNGFSPGDGRMSWPNAIDWAAALTVDGVSGWRLPSMNLDGDLQVYDCSGAPQESEANCMDNEYDHLYTYTGITAGSPGPFANVMGDSRYWSGSERPSNPTNDAKSFSFASGGPGDANKELVYYYAWAVHDPHESRLLVRTRGGTC